MSACRSLKITVYASVLQFVPFESQLPTPITSFPMPTKPERQLIAEVANLAYLASIVSESQMLVDPPTSSESESSDSSSSSDSDSDEPDGGQVLAPSDSMVNLLGLLYSRRYLADRQPINKSGENLHLLLTDWKHGQPDVFRAHVCMTPECFDVLLATCQAPYTVYVLCFNFIVKDIIETFILDLKRTLKRTPLTTNMFPNFASDLSMQLAISRVPGNLYGDCEYALTMRTISNMQLFGLSPAFTFKLSFLVINKE
jgi:hypothetical protein